MSLWTCWAALGLFGCGIGKVAGGASDGSAVGTDASSADNDSDGRVSTDASTDAFVRDGAVDSGRSDGGGFVVDPNSLRARVSSGLPLIGAAANVSALDNDMAYRSLLQKEFNAVTPENATKWESIQPQQGTFTFANADAIVG
ncbi:MAG: endo-1,4-beta-xylanase, partial [Myxococcales bacterium]|nr:endo-1,4-beta-xylanase [Myxococcales bacterium]